MLKIFFFLFVFITSLISESLNFSEQRYSDALGTSITLEGQISFKEESLHIKYNDSNREILYEDSILILKQNGEILELDEMESQRVSQYFEILLLLHSGDEEVLKEKFNVKKKENKSELIPKGYVANFLQMIEL